MAPLTPLQLLALIAGYVLCFLLGALGILVLRDMYIGKIDLTKLISEPTGDASMSRFQFLIFTFVIALSLFLVVVAKSDFPYVPPTVLTLLGISGSSYLVSKGIQFSDPAGITPPSIQDIVVTPVQVLVRYGQTQQFTAQVPNKPGSSVKWAVIAGTGTINDSGLYAAPAAAPAGTTPGSQAHATIQATSDEFPDAHDVAVITLV